MQSFKHEIARGNIALSFIIIIFCFILMTIGQLFDRYMCICTVLSKDIVIAVHRYYGHLITERCVQKLVGRLNGNMDFQRNPILLDNRSAALIRGGDFRGVIISDRVCSLL